MLMMMHLSHILVWEDSTWPQLRAFQDLNGNSRHLLCMCISTMCTATGCRDIVYQSPTPPPISKDDGTRPLLCGGDPSHHMKGDFSPLTVDTEGEIHCSPLSLPVIWGWKRYVIHNGVMRHGCSHVLRAMTVWSYDDSYELRAISTRNDNNFYGPRAITEKRDTITFLHCVKVLCDNAKT